MMMIIMVMILTAFMTTTMMMMITIIIIITMNRKYTLNKDRLVDFGNGQLFDSILFHFLDLESMQ